ncbi:hypothetical protein PBN151_0738 [Paenibacillus sp. NAIST15-1]|nr:hypothetical protein PBN151_0738 [Paenibacillus sp. NAIST15-1]
MMQEQLMLEDEPVLFVRKIGNRKIEDDSHIESEDCEVGNVTGNRSRSASACC